MDGWMDRWMDRWTDRWKATGSLGMGQTVSHTSTDLLPRRMKQSKPGRRNSEALTHLRSALQPLARSVEFTTINKRHTTKSQTRMANAYPGSKSEAQSINKHLLRQILGRRSVSEPSPIDVDPEPARERRVHDLSMARIRVWAAVARGMHRLARAQSCQPLCVSAAPRRRCVKASQSFAYTRAV